MQQMNPLVPDENFPDDFRIFIYDHRNGFNQYGALLWKEKPSKAHLDTFVKNGAVYCIRVKRKLQRVDVQDPFNPSTIAGHYYTDPLAAERANPYIIRNGQRGRA